MAHTKFEWIVQNRILLYKPQGKYSLETIEAAADAARTFLETSHKPYVIVDTTHVTTLPHLVREPVQVFRPVLETYDVQWTFVITSNALMRFLGMVVANTANVQFRPVSALPDALATIERLEPELAAYLQEAIA